MTIIHDLHIKVRSNIEGTDILIDHKIKMTSIEGNYIESSQSRRMFVESPMNFNIIQYIKSSWIPDFETLHLLGDIDIPENDYEYLRHRGNIDKRVVRENDLVVIDISHYGLEQELKTFIKYSYKNNISILLFVQTINTKLTYLLRKNDFIIPKNDHHGLFSRMGLKLSTSYVKSQSLMIYLSQKENILIMNPFNDYSYFVDNNGYQGIISSHKLINKLYHTMMSENGDIVCLNKEIYGRYGEKNHSFRGVFRQHNYIKFVNVLNIPFPQDVDDKQIRKRCTFNHDVDPRENPRTNKKCFYCF